MRISLGLHVHCTCIKNKQHMRCHASSASQHLFMPSGYEFRTWHKPIHLYKMWWVTSLAKLMNKYYHVIFYEKDLKFSYFIGNDLFLVYFFLWTSSRLLFYFIGWKLFVYCVSIYFVFNDCCSLYSCWIWINVPFPFLTVTRYYNLR